MATYNGIAGDENSWSRGFDKATANFDDFLNGGTSGRDTLQGYRGSDTIVGGTEDDLLYGDTKSAANLSADDIGDYLYGEGGNDTLTGNAGNDYLNGGTENDTAVFSGAYAQYRITKNVEGTAWFVTDLRTGSPDGTDTLVSVETLRFSDGDRAPSTLYPTVAVNNLNLLTDQWFRVGGFTQTARDSANHAITQYEFLDTGGFASSAYFWTPQNSHHAANTYFRVNASDLPNVWVRGGQSTGVETMWVRAYDGSEWSDWDSFTVNTYVNTRPTVAVADHSAGYNEWVRVNSWLTTQDVNGDAITQYQFYDGGAGSGSGYFWTPQNDHHPANTAITVNAADLSQVWIRGGTSGGSETMWVRVFDGHDWSDWDSFTFTTEDGNGISTATPLQHLPATVNASVGFNGDTADYFRFVAPGNGTVTATLTGLSADIDLYAANSSQALLTSSTAGGTTSEVVHFQVVSGQTYYVEAAPFANSASNYSLNISFANRAPVATISDHTLNANQFAQIAGWLSYSDADGSPATQYQFWDGGAAATSGYFWTPDNSHHPAQTAITVAAADISHVWVRGGQAPGTEVMWVRAFDGTTWSAWDQFALITA